MLSCPQTIGMCQKLYGWLDNDQTYRDEIAQDRTGQPGDRDRAAKRLPVCLPVLIRLLVCVALTLGFAVSFGLGGSPALAQTPPAPTAPVLTIQGITGRITLTWTVVPGATTYNLYRGTGSGTETSYRVGIPPASIPPASGGTTSFTDTGINNQSSYYYQLTAVGPGGESAKSAEVSDSALAAPATVTVHAGDSQISIAWAAAPGATSYNLYRSFGIGTAGSGQETLCKSGLTSASSPYSDTGLENGQTYYYQVTAVRPGTESDTSPEVSATTQPPPPLAPTGLSATAGNGQVTLSWTAAANAASYTVYRATSSGAEAAPAVTSGVTGISYTDTGLANGIAQYYVVTASDAGGESAWSVEAHATPSGACATPTGLMAFPAHGKVSLSWNSVAGAASYKVYRSNGNSPFTTTSTFSVSKTANASVGYVDTTASTTDGITYYYEVTSVNGSAESAATAAVAATTGTPPSVPSGVSATGSTGQVTLSWPAVSGASSYNVYRGTNAGSELPQPLLTGVTGTGPVDSTAVNGQVYFYKVTAVGPAGANGSNGPESAASAEVSTTPLAAPTNLTGQAGNSQVSLAWYPVAGAKSYNVYRSTSSGTQGSKLNAGILTNPTYLDSSSLSNGTTYYYQVTAVATGSESLPSAQTVVPIPNVPLAPTGLSATAGNAQAALQWTPASGATSYILYRGTQAGGAASYLTGLTGTSYTDTGLVNGTTYYYQITALNSSGESARAAEVSALPLGPPGAASYLSATATSPTQIQLYWGASAGATGYTLTRSGGSSGNGSFPLSVTGTSFQDSGLTAGTSYTYQVQATGGGGGSTANPSATTSTLLPAPMGLTAIPNATQATLTWTALPGASSYNLYRSSDLSGQGGSGSVGSGSGQEKYPPLVTGLTGTSYTDTGLTAGAYYYYTLKAVDAGGESAASTEAVDIPYLTWSCRFTPNPVSVSGDPGSFISVIDQSLPLTNSFIPYNGNYVCNAVLENFYETSDVSYPAQASFSQPFTLAVSATVAGLSRSQQFTGTYSGQFNSTQTQTQFSFATPASLAFNFGNLGTYTFSGLNYAPPGPPGSSINGGLGALITYTPATDSVLTLLSVAGNDSSVLGGNPSSGTVTLNMAAPSGGTVVSLVGNSSSAQLPATVTIPAGAASATFSFTTSPVSTATPVSLTGTLNGLSASGSVIVNPSTLLTLAVSPATVVGGHSSQGSVTLTSPAPSGGATVTLASGNAAATVPASVFIAAGSRTAPFTVMTTPVTATTSATVSATYASQTVSAPLTITTAARLSLQLTPTSVVGGSTSQGKVTLSSPAPTGGTLITLSSDSTAAGVSVGAASVTVSAGQRTATFTVATQPVGSTVTATISAVEGSDSASAPLTVTPPVLTGLSLSPSSVTGGDYSIGTVTIGSPAPAGGLSISLLSDNTAAVVLPTVVIAGGATSGTFSISTSAITTPTSANISATLGVTKTAALAISAFSSVVVIPGNAVVQTGATQQFIAVAQDQNGVALTNQPAFTWTVTGGGTISNTGLFTAGSSAGGPFTVTATALGQSGPASVTVETSGTPTTKLSLFTTMKATDWTIAGLGGIRGIGSGIINLSDVTGTVTKAYLYWHGPTSSTDPTANATVMCNGTSITGTNIGFASSNCWNGYFSNSQAYRADVTNLVSGNGSYTLTNFIKPGSIDINGVTLIVFFNDGNPSNNRDVMIFDGNDSNVDYQAHPSSWDDTFQNINYVAGTAANLWLGVSDGQSFLDGAVDISNNNNHINLLPGGEANFDGDTTTSPTHVTYGSSTYGSSVEQTQGGLWDIRMLDLTQNSILIPGSNTVHLTSPWGGDCLSLVYAIIDQPSSGSGGSSPSSPPTIATAASASPNPVTGTSTTLSVLGADASGEANLTYTWQLVAAPPSPVFLSLNGTNAAKNTVATFTQAGTYMFQVTVRNASGLTAASNVVTVTVNQTLSSLSIAPATAKLPLNGTQQFTPTLTDQFGAAMSSSPAITWSISGGVGSISTIGLYAAGAAPGAATVQAAAGTLTATASVTVASAPPTIATAASASPNPAPGTTTTLSVLGADDGGESNLTYTWATMGTPPAAVTFSANGNNAAKTSVATFTKVGSYNFQVTVRDAGGQTVTSSVTVTVNPTLTAITVSPAVPTLNSRATQQFAATAKDQFGAPLSPQPVFTWTVSGAGSISSLGLYTASDAAGTATVTATSGSISGTANVSVAVSAPTISVVASATPNPATGTTTTLSVLGADASGEGNLTYTWATTGTPPAAVTYSANGTNAAKNTVATFTKAGSYAFQVTAQNPGGMTVASSVTVTVSQTLTAITVSPVSATLHSLATQQFTASAKDQFAAALSSQPTFTWSVDGGGVGTISSSGLYTASAASGSATVRATSGGLSGTAGITVTNASPTIATIASASPNPVTGTTTTLSVLGADDGGQGNLTYTWATTGTPPAAVTFSANGTNAAKSSVATFTKAGSYAFTVTVTDAGGAYATSSVTVTVNQTLTTIAVTPASISVQTGTTRQFSTSAADQFGTALTNQPTLTWSVSGVGSISSGGLYTAGSTAGSATVKAASGSVSGTASVIVTAVVPVLTSITVSPTPVSVIVSHTQQFTATALDQNGKSLASQPSFTWSVASGVGSVSAGGLYTAPSSAGTASVQAASGGLSGTASVTVTTAMAPTISVVASASPNPVTGTTTTLSVLGADASGESNLTYTWATTGTPPAAVTFSVNGTNAAKTSVATFTKAGSYAFTVTVTNVGGAFATSNVTVTVNQTLTTISISPATVALNSLATQPFTASAKDQFGAALSSQPSFAWSVDGGGGSITAGGLYTAPAAAGNATVRATSGGLSGTASVTVTNSGPTIATIASASPNPVPGTTTTLSVLGADASGESNLTYTWANTGTPPAAVTFSANGSNAAKTAVATFTKAGSYTFQVTITDAGGAIATSSVTVTVNQTLTTIGVLPASATLQTGATQPFTAAASDQFGQALATQPPFAWTVTGGGTIGSVSGTFLAGNAAGGPFTVTAAAGGKSGTAPVTLLAAVPIATPVIAVAGGAGAAAVSITDGTPGAVIFYTLDGSAPTSASPPYQGPFVVTSTTIISAVAYLRGSHSLTAVATAIVTAGSGGSVPSVLIASPADGTVQTGAGVGTSPVIPILGSISGASLSAWTLAYRPVAGDDGNGGTWIPLAAGTTAQASGSTLGTLDPTLMLNGLYQIELTAYNAAGQSSSTLVTILIKGDQKVGYFTLSYNDLTVPVAGLPITITRTYDSRNKALGDFGTGWTLSTTNVKVQKADTVGLDWTELISGLNYALAPNVSHLITITFPNGDTYNFAPYIAPQSGAPYDSTGGTINYAAVGPVQGATLVGKYNPGGIPFIALTLSGGGGAVGVELDGLDDSGLDSGFPADETEFILTLRNGKQFDVSIDGGLQSIRDLNGNTLTFMPDGIYSSNYSSSTPVVSYQRTNGLITKITGPGGIPLKYAQTGTDLTGFTDRAGNASTYDYDYSHDLTGIHDPRGLEPLRNDYDATGRLLDSMDADQNKITYSYNLTGHTQTVLDRLGHETDLTYDSYGNVTAKTQHLIVGGVDTPITTTSVFGDSNNPDKKTQETDPLGRIMTYGYLSTGELQTATQKRLGAGLDAVTGYVYNNYGEPLTVQDANNQGTTNYATTNSYDASGNLQTTQDAVGNTTHYFYNANGTLDHTVDAFSPAHTTHFYYDASPTGVYPAGAYLTRTVDALGHTTTFDYDADGNKTSQVQTRTNPVTQAAETLLTKFFYDADDRLVQTNVYAANSTTIVLSSTATHYNSIGKPDYTIAPGSAAGTTRTTSYKYDSQGRLYETDYPDGTTSTTTYDLNGQRIASKDRSNRWTGSVYDTLGRLTVSGPLQAASPFKADGSLNFVLDGSGNPLTSRTVYDNAGEVVQEFDANNNRGTSADKPTVTTYDDLGRKATVTDPAGNVTVYNDATDSGYDLNGNQLQVKDARGNYTKFVYDLDNRVLETDLYKSNGTTLLTRSSTVYDALGRRSTSTSGAAGVNADPRTTGYQYDAVGRLQSVTTPGNHTETYGYDEIGEKISQTDANSHITKFAYDERGHLVQKTLPLLPAGYSASNQSETFTYNPDGSVSTHTDFNGLTTTYAYDPASGRLLSKSTPSNGGQWVAYDYYPGGQRQDAYRGHGALVQANTDSTVTNAYDPDRGLLTSVTSPGGTLTYAYDNVGNKTSLLSPSGTTTYDYDADNRLFHVYRSGSTVATYGYDPNGNRQSLALLNGVTTTYTYDEANRLTNLVNAKSGTTLSSYAYTLYASGKRQVVTDSAGATITYTYNSDGRLTGEVSAGLSPAINNSYGLDAVGNRTSLNGSSITYDANDRLTTSGHTYDANGNEMTVNGQAATYDFENHLTGLAGTGGSTGPTVYTYDADGNRLSAATSVTTGGVTTTTATGYLVDTTLPFASVVEEYNNGTLAARYDYGDDLLRQDRTGSGGSLLYYLYDGLGSTRQLTDASGVVKDGYLYDAYGVQLAHSPNSLIPNSFLFQGQQLDTASGDYYFRARYYDQSSGRFISQDPFEGDTDDPISLHKYLYASGDPMDNIDPGGNEDFSITDAAFSLGISAAVGSSFSYLAVSALGGDAGLRRRAAFYGGEAGLALAYAYGTDNLGLTLFAGFLGATTVVTLDYLVSPEDFNKPGQGAEDAIEGFATAAATTAFGDGRSVKVQAAAAGSLTLFQDSLDTLLKDYVPGKGLNTANFLNKLGLTLADSAAAAIIAIGAGTALGTQFSGKVVKEAKKLVEGKSAEEVSEKVVAAVYGEIQYITSSAVKVFDAQGAPTTTKSD